MAKTYEDLLSESRVLIQDSDTVSRRYTDATLLAILNRGLQELGRVRPDAFYETFSNNSLNVFEVVVDSPGAGQIAWTDAFDLEYQFYSPLVGHVAAVAEIVDDEYTVDGRAALLIQQFRNSLIGL